MNRYLSRGSFLDASSRAHEPALAIFSPGGVKHACYRAIRDALRRRAAANRPLLQPGGWLLLEAPAGQADAIAELFVHEQDGQANTQVLALEKIVADRNGTPRCVVLRATPPAQ